MTRFSRLVLIVASAAACGLATGPIAQGQSTRPTSPLGQSRQQLPPRQATAESTGGRTTAGDVAGRTRLTPEQQAQLDAQLAQEQAELDRVLSAWERENKRIKTLSAQFKMWEYIAAFPAAKPGMASRECEGEIYFAAPDHGMYHEKMEGGAYWVCDGQAVYELNHKKSEVVEHPLPEELRGKGITNGPLPFVFGADAAAMKQRYSMRVVTPSDADKGQIWLEAYPRYQNDAANFRKVQVILDQQTMLPRGLQLLMPNGKDRTVYAFGTPKVNDLWEKIKGFFDPPLLPRGWKHVIERPPVARNEALQPRDGQSQRVPPPTNRR